MEWLLTTDHGKPARHAITFSSVLLIAGILGLFLPASDEPARRGLGLPIWGVAVLVIVLASFALVLALLQRRREKRGE
ncbi:hypothetical protein [Clavibacter michiganensis]|uniref:hypothetical protein n=1 Tax=Clavibacter michiganensis TaxID=28447 RepID=UPI0005BBD05A|nr:hypothetical protein [Clavibacter michiganensis]